MSDVSLVPPESKPPQDSKPGKPRGGSSSRSRSRSRRTNPSLEAPLRSLFTTAGEVWGLSDDVCGPALVEIAPRLAKAIDTSAKDNPEVYEFWSKLLGSGSTAGVLLAAMPFVQVVMLHHLVPLVARIRERREAALFAVPDEVPEGFGDEPFAPEAGNDFVTVPAPEDELPFEPVNPNEFASD